MDGRREGGGILGCRQHIQHELVAQNRFEEAEGFFVDGRDGSAGDRDAGLGALDVCQVAHEVRVVSHLGREACEKGGKSRVEREGGERKIFVAGDLGAGGGGLLGATEKVPFPVAVEPDFHEVGDAGLPDGDIPVADFERDFKFQFQFAGSTLNATDYRGSTRMAADVQIPVGEQAQGFLCDQKNHIFAVRARQFADFASRGVISRCARVFSCDFRGRFIPLQNRFCADLKPRRFFRVSF